MTKKPDTLRTRIRPASNKAAPARPARKASARGTLRSADDAPYHHGALRDALLEAAERVLERDPSRQTTAFVSYQMLSFRSKL